MKPPTLAVERILALQPPSLRMAVPDSWADSNGHMNMRWYVASIGPAPLISNTTRISRMR